MADLAILVRAEWHPEAGANVAMSNDVPGLTTEAVTRDALRQKLTILIPELLA